MNAITLELLIRIYYRDVELAELTSNAEHTGLAFITTDGLVAINEATKTISITEKGMFHVKHLLEHPLPVPIIKWEYKDMATDKGMTTDKEKLKQLLTEFGIGFEETECRIECKEGMRKVQGYNDFTTIFEFDPMGKFIFMFMGAWE